MNFAEYLTNRCALIEKHLDKLVAEHRAPQSLFTAARYSLLGGGKRLRPILALAAVETLGGDLQSALTPACALEMIHTYSLIHDDLPCMDNDDFRRGKPSLHKAFPEGQAVLAGDFLLTQAFQVIAEDVNLNNDKKIRLISTLAKRAGGDGMIAGQVMDLESEGKKIDFETLRRIHNNKTGALIKAAIEFGGILSDVSETNLQILQKFGEEIGLAFQIVDDVLDVTASMNKHGKAIASDITNSKATYVTLLGLEQSQEAAQQMLKSARATLNQLPGNHALLLSLAENIVQRKN